jgi:predicted DNA-binding transcriptional regulator YafY
MKTGRVSRIIRLLTVLQSGQRYGVDDLAKILGIGRRTVFRDLKDLQRAGVPCRYDKRSRYYAIDPEFFLPAPDLSVQETLGLFLLAHKIRDHIHLPFGDSALRAVLKIENNLPDKMKRFCNKALNSISVRTAPQAAMDLLDKVFVQLVEAVVRKRIVSIRYDFAGRRQTRKIDLSPCHLLYNDHAWYVLAKSALEEKVSAFKLNRIKELTMSDKCFVEDEEFDVDEYLGSAWSITPEGRLYHVKLRFSPDIAVAVSEVQWHSSQTVDFEDDGSVILRFRVDGLDEILWWVLSYGDKVRVLAPEVLRRRIVEIAQNTVRQNEQSLRV